MTRRLRKSIRLQLIEALRPFVESYRLDAEPIGDSDLDNEQPRAVRVSLGDCRTASALLHNITFKKRPS